MPKQQKLPADIFGDVNAAFLGNGALVQHDAEEKARALALREDRKNQVYVAFKPAEPTIVVELVENFKPNSPAQRTSTMTLQR